MPGYGSYTLHLEVGTEYHYEEVEFYIEGRDDNGHFVNRRKRYDLHYVVILIGGDFDKRSRERDYRGDLETEDEFTLTPVIGLRLFPKRNVLSPYLFTNVGKDIPLVTSVKRN